jgi:hypothetical protein
MLRLFSIHRPEQGCVPRRVLNPDGTRIDDFCPDDNAANAANFDGLLKDSSGSLAALPRVACRFD